MGEDGPAMSAPAESADTALPLAERLLDGAAAVIGRYGLRRTTMDDVARAAHCSRPTAYKHYGTREALLAAVFVREAERYLDGLAGVPTVAGQGQPAALEEAFVYTLRFVRGNPLLQAVASDDPTGIYDVLSLDGGRVLAVLIAGITRFVTKLAEAGALRAGVAVEPVVEAFIRIVASFLLLPRVVVDPLDEDAARTLFRVSVIEGVAPSETASRQSRKRR
jgi:AcrR family transcriptional regulator